MSIQGISLENFTELTQTETSTTPQVRTRHYEFHSFLFDDRKQYAEENISHIKLII